MYFVCYLVSGAVCCVLPAHFLSAVCCLLSAVCCLMSGICCHVSGFWCQRFPVIRHVYLLIPPKKSSMPDPLNYLTMPPPHTR